VIRQPDTAGRSAIADSPSSEPALHEQWLRLDELTNALDYLETCCRVLETFPDPIRWKWAILALHQAIYGFAICAVRGTDSRSVLVSGRRGAHRLIPVWEALARAQEPARLWPTASPLVLTTDEEAALHRLFDEFRNGFAHFQPCGWSIEVSGMADLFQPAVAVLRRLALDLGAVRYYEESDRARAVLALARLEASLTACAAD
jgi:hypothetical protein